MPFPFPTYSVRLIVFHFNFLGSFAGVLFYVRVGLTLFMFSLKWPPPGEKRKSTIFDKTSASAFVVLLQVGCHGKVTMYGRQGHDDCV